MKPDQLQALLDALTKLTPDAYNDHTATALLVTSAALVDIALSLRTLLANQQRCTLEDIRASIALWDEAFPQSIPAKPDVGPTPPARAHPGDPT